MTKIMHRKTERNDGETNGKVSEASTRREKEKRLTSEEDARNRRVGGVNRERNASYDDGEDYGRKGEEIVSD